VADLKISQLTALDSGDVASTDVLAVVDVSATQTKKITAIDLATYVNGLAPAGVTTLDGLDDVTITSVSNGELLSYDGSAWVNSAPVASFNPIEAAVFL
jgi:hypothetical protein